MAMKIKGSQGNKPVQDTRGMESSYRSLVSSSQQRLFQNVLNQTRTFGTDKSKQEINSLRKELNDLQTTYGYGQKVDHSAGTNASRTLEEKGLSALPTSDLLKITTMSPSRGMDRLNGYGKTGGTDRKGSLSAQSKTDAANSLLSRSGSGLKGPGALSARFESGGNSLEAIGYDGGGGTSYGLYQIASRVGTMDRFLDYLKEHAPKWATRLKAAGPSDTGSTEGRMPREWKKIAAEDPERFSELQHDFIEKTHYLPALQEILNKTGVNIEEQSRTLQEVLWSTAVQHGPRGAAKMFCKAMSGGNLQGKPLQAQNLISSVYSSRAKQFGSSASETRGAVVRRFQEEKLMALAMLANETKGLEARA